ncbi:probable receptor-like protein kinase At2g23200 [Fagus crenata]
MFRLLIHQKNNVSASGFSLLTNFSIRNSSSSPVIKEFLLTIPQGEFRIHFIPSQQSSFAFVNAIEVFLANESRITNNATRVTSAGNDSTYNVLLSQALHTIHRINFGGSTITYDELWRSWVPDDSYLIFHGDSAMNSTLYSQTPNYELFAQYYTAPDRVYQTAKQLKPGSSGNASILNLTWSFPVSKNTKHFFRVHFCDIISKTADDLQFNLYIYSNFNRRIYPYGMTDTSVIATPFFIDYVVDSDNSGFINFSVSPSEQDSRVLNAFVNGLEIMEVMTNKSGLIPQECDESEKRHLPVITIVGSVCGGVFVILIVVVALRLKYRKAEADQSLGGLIFGGMSFNRLSEGSSTGSLPAHLKLSLRIPFADIQPAINNLLPMEEMNLADWGMMWQRKGQLEKIIDPMLVDKIKPSSLRKFGETAEKCLKANSVQRPTMQEVLYDLQYALQLQETAMHRDPHEDSTTNTSLELQLPLIWNLPSNRTPIEEDDHAPIGGDDDSDTTASESLNPIEDR